MRTHARTHTHTCARARAYVMETEETVRKDGIKKGRVSEERSCREGVQTRRRSEIHCGPEPFRDNNTHNKNWGWAESTGGCVKLKTVTEIRLSNARNTSITEHVYLCRVRSQWRDLNRGEMWSVLRCFFFFFFWIFYYEASSTVLSSTKAFGQRKQAGQKGENCSSWYVTE